MKKILKKLKIIESETSAERGSYELFALFLRDNSPGKWDILVSADWIDNNNKGEALEYLGQKIKSLLNTDELLQISHIVIIENDDPRLSNLQKKISVEHGFVELKNTTIFGLQIERAFFITSKRREVA